MAFPLKLSVLTTSESSSFPLPLMLSMAVSACDSADRLLESYPWYRRSSDDEQPVAKSNGAHAVTTGTCGTIRLPAETAARPVGSAGDRSAGDRTASAGSATTNAFSDHASPSPSPPPGQPGADCGTANLMSR
jgi:hypothetical protein